MAQADLHSTTPRLSSLSRDPFVADAFRAERDNGNAFSVVLPTPVTLAGGAAEKLEPVS